MIHVSSFVEDQHLIDSSFKYVCLHQTSGNITAPKNHLPPGWLQINKFTHRSTVFLNAAWFHENLFLVLTDAHMAAASIQWPSLVSVASFTTNKHQYVPYFTRCDNKQLLCSPDALDQCARTAGTSPTLLLFKVLNIIHQVRMIDLSPKSPV